MIIAPHEGLEGARTRLVMPDHWAALSSFIQLVQAGDRGGPVYHENGTTLHPQGIISAGSTNGLGTFSAVRGTSEGLSAA